MANILTKSLSWSGIKNWCNETFATTTTTNSLSTRITALESASSDNLTSAMPDYSRAVFMEMPNPSNYENNNSENKGINPGNIYKINVPGYIHMSTISGTPNQDNDTWFKVAAHPGYLYRNGNTSPTIGSTKTIAYSCTNHVNQRAMLGGASNYNTNGSPWFGLPIVPGTSTYLRSCTWSSTKTYLIFFVPIKGLSDSISPDDYFTYVGRGHTSITHDNGTNAESWLGPCPTAFTTNFNNTRPNIAPDIFAGDWQDNFSSSWVLNTSNIKTVHGFYSMSDGKNDFDEDLWVLTEPTATGYYRVWYCPNHTNYILRYVTSTEITNAGYSSLDTDAKTHADNMRSKWCVMHPQYSLTSSTPSAIAQSVTGSSTTTIGAYTTLSDMINNTHFILDTNFYVTGDPNTARITDASDMTGTTPACTKGAAAATAYTNFYLTYADGAYAPLTNTSLTGAVANIIYNTSDFRDTQTLANPFT